MNSLAQKQDPIQKVLVIDDDKEWGRRTCDYLAKKQCRAFLATTLQEALGAISAGSYQLILLDLIANSTGLAFLRKLKEHTKLKALPVIVFTAVEDEKQLEFARKFGALASIKKSAGLSTLDPYFTATPATTKKPEEGEDKSTAKELLNELKEKLQSEELELPSQPSLLYRLITLLGNDDSSLKDISSLVEKEPSIATKVLKAANSTDFAGAKPAIDVNEAVMRIGIKRTLNYVLVINQGQMFQTETHPFKQVREAVWFHSLQTAVIARYFGEELRYSRPDNLFAFGLLHDIGKFALIRMLQEFPNNDRLSATNIRDLVDKLHVQLGYSLFSKWGFPKEFVEVVRFHHDPPIRDKHGKHLVTASFSNIVCHALESGWSENARNQLLREPHAGILKVRPANLENLNRVVEEEMKKLRELM